MLGRSMNLVDPKEGVCRHIGPPRAPQSANAQ